MKADSIRDCLWSFDALPDALFQALLRAGADGVAGGVAPLPFVAQQLGAHMDRWLACASRSMGFDGNVQRVSSARLHRALDEAGAYVIVVPSARQALALLRGGGDACTLVRPTGTDRPIDLYTLHEQIAALATPLPETAALFAQLPDGERAFDRLATRLRTEEVLVARYELDATNSIVTQLRARHFTARSCAYVALASFQSFVAILAAWTLGDAALTGLVDAGRVAAWGMLAASDIPLGYLATNLLGRMTVDFAAIIKKRLLEGALVLKDASARKQSFAAALARLSEATLIEQTNPAELLELVPALAQLIAAVVLLWLAPLAPAFLALLALFLAVVIGTFFVLRPQHRNATDARVGLTSDLVEKIVGHRTRAVQANAERLHDVEDLALQRYAKLIDSMDLQSSLLAGVGRAWLAASGSLLAIAFVLGATPAKLLPPAVGIFFGFRAFVAITGSLSKLLNWLDAWRGVRGMFAAGRVPLAEKRAPVRDDGGLDTVISSLSFAYRGGGRAVFTDADLRLRAGERILVEGPSGGGKTTLGKLLTGELRPGSGTVLVDGVDRFSVSEEDWRKRVAASPQFHENYIFSNTFAFNLDPNSLGNSMSPAAVDICRELGLDAVLDKMPSRELQILGENGWQLSHGERSRVFIARSLLQGARLLILDESFGALDPESLLHAVSCVRRHAATLLVIAHT